MLVQLGSRSDSLDVIDLLLDCHAKIRRFISIAKRLAVGDSDNLADIRTAAAAITRYFTDAFPLHVTDENELILPRLFGRSDRVDAALLYMRSDHATHASLIDSLTILCCKIRDEPKQLAAVAPGLRTVLVELEPLIEDHLAMEEADIFPVLSSLEPAERGAIMAAMRERRTVR